MMRHVNVPDDVARDLAKQMRSGRTAKGSKPPATPRYIPVVAIVNGKSARTTLVPAGGGRYRMQINTALRKAAHADVGDVVSVELRIDRKSRALPVPPDLQAGLKGHPKAWKAFQALAPGQRRQFIQWFDSAKSPVARSRRLDRAVDVLLERALLRDSR
ncbi:MAG: YdeI/OmpD-associated family protein [Acidobacteriia bacterium]|nr:YdeI/OmpD-associated family protein [Terriglobia bacterium]